MRNLSIEGQVIYGCFFQADKKRELTFDRPEIISPRFRKGLDDLANAGYLMLRQTVNGPKGSLTWRPTALMVMEKTTITPRYLMRHAFSMTTCEDV
jgi:hypothetical protein